MSRLGKLPVNVPSGVNVSISGATITISKGDKTLSYTFRPEVNVDWSDSDKTVTVTIDENDVSKKQCRAYWGLTRAIIQNMVVGVTEGYTKKLEVVGVGYTAQLAGNQLNLKVGFANTITKMVPTGVNVVVEKQHITITGPDKQAVGQFAAEVRAVRKPEPYNGKGIKYSDEVVVRKQGKAFGS